MHIFANFEMSLCTESLIFSLFKLLQNAQHKLQTKKNVMPEEHKMNINYSMNFFKLHQLNVWYSTSLYTVIVLYTVIHVVTAYDF